MEKKIIVNEDQYNKLQQLMMDTMAQNLGSQDNPKVGIFWYNRQLKDLFGVIAVDKDGFQKPNAGGGLITCKELHQDVWRKEFNRQKHTRNGQGPFVGDYKDTPRGRVFYNLEEDKFYVMVGSWINDVDYDNFISLVEDYYDLKNSDFEIKIGPHWEIGVGWENR